MNFKQVLTILASILIISQFVYNKYKPNIVVAEGSIWTLLSNLPYPIHNNPSHIFIDNIFSFGGSENSVHNEVLSNILFSNTNSSWSYSSSSAIPKSLFWHNAAFNHQSVYILGGCEWPNQITISTDTVYLGEIKNNFIKNWVETSKLPIPVADGSSIVVNNRIYFSGGAIWYGNNYDHPDIRSTIYMADITPNGTLGSWREVGNLPTVSLGHSMININNYIYIIGGVVKTCPFNNVDCYETTSKVWRGTINNDGSISDWIDTENPLAHAMYHFMATRMDNYLVIAGGRGIQLHYPAWFDNVYYAEIFSDGSLGKWIESINGRLPKPTCCAGIANKDNNLYIIGGHSPGEYLNSVWTTSIDKIVNHPLSPVNPVIFIPGMFACWNQDAILHDAQTFNEQWVIPNFVDIYDGLLSTLKSVGYEEGTSLYVYCYDWRKNILDNAINLSSFIQKQVLRGRLEKGRVDLIGHSMGGLIARASAISTPLIKINKVITIGSPHQGSALAYREWEGADLSQIEGWQRLLGELYLRVRSTNYNNPIDVLRNSIPSIQNLLPIYNYLVNKNNTIKSVQGMVWKNNLLPVFDQDLSLLLPHLATLGGNGIDTLKFIKITEPSAKDKQQNKWVDGKPIENVFSIEGDGTVLFQSSTLPGAEIEEINGANHGEIITEAEGQIKILQLLGLEGSTHTIYPKRYRKAIVVSVASPVSFNLINPSGQKLEPDNGLVILEDPPDGDYLVNLTSIDSGNYTLYFGRLTHNDSAWETVEGNFTASQQTNSLIFKVNFEQNNLGADPFSDSLNRIIKIKEIINNSSEKNVTKLIFLNFINQLERKILKMNAEKGKILEVNTMSTENDIDKIISEANKYSITAILGHLRLIKMDIEQYLGDQQQS